MQLVSARVGFVEPGDKSGAIWTDEQVRAKARGGAVANCGLVVVVDRRQRGHNPGRAPCVGPKPPLNCEQVSASVARWYTAG